MASPASARILILRTLVVRLGEGVQCATAAGWTDRWSFGPVERSSVERYDQPERLRRRTEEVTMDCEKVPTCVFFNDQIEEMPAVAELLKIKYCRGVFDECARFRVATKLGGPNVPRDLAPNDTSRASELLASQR